MTPAGLRFACRNNFSFNRSLGHGYGKVEQVPYTGITVAAISTSIAIEETPGARRQTPDARHQVPGPGSPQILSTAPPATSSLFLCLCLPIIIGALYLHSPFCFLLQFHLHFSAKSNQPPNHPPLCILSYPLFSVRYRSLICSIARCR